MKTIVFWSVSVINDCEGRTSKTIARFDSERNANLFSTTNEGRDVYNQAGIVQRHEFAIAETLEEAGCEVKSKLIATAKAKLTRQERIALGIQE